MASVPIIIVINPAAWLLNYMGDAIVTGFTSFFWMLLLFDPVLNKSRKRAFSWSYLGEDDGFSRRLNKLFGKRAGEWKAIFCILSIVGLNILYRYI